ncbi:hypothetical protein EV426DRAFT_704765 [Tirmania nivea]|nr:hypothetical protein EV426DRAFT_704765 [Tirmania nivea]
MPKYYDGITPELAEWALSQAVFWTATAPLVGKHVNISPKGLPGSSFAILGPNRVAYIDYTGSAAETISHLYENKRITILFNSFTNSPRIMRMFCMGRVVEAAGEDRAEFERLIGEMGMDVGKVHPSARAVLVMNVWKVQTSCGYGVPIAKVVNGEEGKVAVEFEDRETLGEWGRKLVERGGKDEYQATWNSRSHDGLVGLKAARRAGGERALWWGNLMAWGRRVGQMGDAVGLGFVTGVGVTVGLGWVRTKGWLTW